MEEHRTIADRLLGLYLNLLPFPFLTDSQDDLTMTGASGKKTETKAATLKGQEGELDPQEGTL